jgi:hypothetical protein
MLTTIASGTMAKKRMGRPPKGRNDVTVRMDVEIKNRCDGVAKLLGMTLNEYLSSRMDSISEKELQAIAKPKLKPSS